MHRGLGGPCGKSRPGLVDSNFRITEECRYLKPTKHLVEHFSPRPADLELLDTTECRNRIPISRAVFIPMTRVAERLPRLRDEE
ncbi:hypothetical protein AVEN_33153-1 [Araneus ventricosus]|uniref:Uncharacterized protein n=1 Tax=Araneus ventricosus TaxID=182803 RepID=A0A4Y2LJ10_ARAVE|nr:hypothetical protein AVEN_33153-1 [Araneus ventricosus]